jgi:hypothetical protein
VPRLHGGVGKMKIGKIGQKLRHNSRGAASSRAKETQQSTLLQSTAGTNETETKPGTSAIAETAAVPKIDKPAVDDGGEVYTDQYVGVDEALAILAEFAKFVIARIASQGRNTIVTVTEEDADQFRGLCDRAELAIGAESAAAGARSRQ